jgi:hypothetical protein
LVEFWNQNGEREYREEIGCNMWVRLSKKYFDEYTLKIYSEGNLISEKKYNAENKRVYIALDSKSLGDTFATDIEVYLTASNIIDQGEF